MVFGRKNEIRVGHGDEIVFTPKGAKVKHSRQHALTQKLKVYGHLLANTYGLSPKQKLTLQQRKERAEIELKRLEEEEGVLSVERKVNAIKNKRAEEKREQGRKSAGYQLFESVGGKGTILDNDFFSESTTRRKSKGDSLDGFKMPDFVF